MLATLFAPVAVGTIVGAGRARSAAAIADRASITARCRARHLVALYAPGLRSASRGSRAPASGLFTPRTDRYRMLAARHDRCYHAPRAATARCSPSRPPRKCSSARRPMSAWQWPVRSRPCCRPTGLSRRAVRRGRQHEERLVEFRFAGPPGRAHRQFLWVEMRCRPRDTVGTDLSTPEVVAVLRDISERKSAGAGHRDRPHGIRTRRRRQDPVPRNDEP